VVNADRSPGMTVQRPLGTLSPWRPLLSSGVCRWVNIHENRGFLIIGVGYIYISCRCYHSLVVRTRLGILLDFVSSRACSIFMGLIHTSFLCIFVHQNLVIHATLYEMPTAARSGRMPLTKGCRYSSHKPVRDFPISYHGFRTHDDSQIVWRLNLVY